MQRNKATRHVPFRVMTFNTAALNTQSASWMLESEPHRGSRTMTGSVVDLNILRSYYVAQLIAENQPDVICLQENVLLPDTSFRRALDGTSTFRGNKGLGPRYECVSCQRKVDDFVDGCAIFVRTDNDYKKSISTSHSLNQETCSFPSVTLHCSDQCTEVEFHICISSVHYTPGSYFRPKNPERESIYYKKCPLATHRFDQFSRTVITHSTLSACHRDISTNFYSIIAGDSNMREWEKYPEGAFDVYCDVFSLLSTELQESARSTFNPYRNRFNHATKSARSSGPRAERYDRIWYRKDANIKPVALSVVGDLPITDKQITEDFRKAFGAQKVSLGGIAVGERHISDHFGVVADFLITSPQTYFFFSQFYFYSLKYFCVAASPEFFHRQSSIIMSSTSDSSRRKSILQRHVVICTSPVKTSPSLSAAMASTAHGTNCEEKTNIDTCDCPCATQREDVTVQGPALSSDMSDVLDLIPFVPQGLDHPSEVTFECAALKLRLNWLKWLHDDVLLPLLLHKEVSQVQICSAHMRHQSLLHLTKHLNVALYKQLYETKDAALLERRKVIRFLEIKREKSSRCVYLTLFYYFSICHTLQLCAVCTCYLLQLPVVICVPCEDTSAQRSKELTIPIGKRVVSALLSTAPIASNSDVVSTYSCNYVNTVQALQFLPSISPNIQHGGVGRASNIGEGLLRCLQQRVQKSADILISDATPLVIENLYVPEAKQLCGDNFLRILNVLRSPVFDLLASVLQHSSPSPDASVKSCKESSVYEKRAKSTPQPSSAGCKPALPSSQTPPPSLPFSPSRKSVKINRESLPTTATIISSIVKGVSAQQIAANFQRPEGQGPYELSVTLREAVVSTQCAVAVEESVVSLISRHRPTLFATGNGVFGKNEVFDDSSDLINTNSYKINSSTTDSTAFSHSFFGAVIAYSMAQQKKVADLVIHEGVIEKTAQRIQKINAYLSSTGTTEDHFFKSHAEAVHVTESLWCFLLEAFVLCLQYHNDRLFPVVCNTQEDGRVSAGRNSIAAHRNSVAVKEFSTPLAQIVEKERILGLICRAVVGCGPRSPKIKRIAAHLFQILSCEDEHTRRSLQLICIQFPQAWYYLIPPLYTNDVSVRLESINAIEAMLDCNGFGAEEGVDVGSVKTEQTVGDNEGVVSIDPVTTRRLETEQPEDTSHASPRYCGDFLPPALSPVTGHPFEDIQAPGVEPSALKLSRSTQRALQIASTILSRGEDIAYAIEHCSRNRSNHCSSFVQLHLTEEQVCRPTARTSHGNDPSAVLRLVIAIVGKYHRYFTEQTNLEKFIKIIWKSVERRLVKLLGYVVVPPSVVQSQTSPLTTFCRESSLSSPATNLSRLSSFTAVTGDTAEVFQLSPFQNKTRPLEVDKDSSPMSSLYGRLTASFFTDPNTESIAPCAAIAGTPPVENKSFRQVSPSPEDSSKRTRGQEEMIHSFRQVDSFTSLSMPRLSVMMQHRGPQPFENVPRESFFTACRSSVPLAAASRSTPDVNGSTSSRLAEEIAYVQFLAAIIRQFPPAIILRLLLGGSDYPDSAVAPGTGAHAPLLMVTESPIYSLLKMRYLSFFPDENSSLPSNINIRGAGVLPGVYASAFSAANDVLRAARR